MMANDLNAIGHIRCAMPVMKIKLIRFNRVAHLDLIAQVPVVISGHHDDFASFRKTAEQLGRFARCRFVVNQIAQNDETAGLILSDEFFEPFRNRRHPPQRHQGSGRALTQFVAEMHVRDREPTLGSVEKRESAVENNFICNEPLIGA